MMGAPPKPTALKLLSGNPGKRPLNLDEPRFPVANTPPPPFLSGPAKREWRRVLPILIGQGLFTVADVAELTLYCQSWGEIGELVRYLRKHGSTYEKWEDGRLVGVRLRPEAGLLDRAKAQVHLFGASFGLNPSARTRLTVPGQKEDTLDALLG